MKLLWNTNKNINSFWGNYHFINSTSWIYTIIEQTKYEIIDHVNKIDEKDQLIIIDSQLSIKKELYEKLSKKCSSIYLIHLGDEGGTEDTNLIYNYCKHVWRTFGLPKYFNNHKITCIPIGYKSGLNLQNKEIIKRKFLWSFMGTIHGSSRYDLIHQNGNLKPHFINKTSNFASEESLDTEKYYAILHDSIFIMVPHGYVHPESYRLYEALESGCVPIIENPHNFYNNFLPKNPLIKINLWKESSEIIKKLLNDKNKLKEKSDEINLWWENYKKNLRNQFKSKINV